MVPTANCFAKSSSSPLWLFFSDYTNYGLVAGLGDFTLVFLSGLLFFLRFLFPTLWISLLVAF